MILLTCRLLKSGTHQLISKAEIESWMRLWGGKGGEGEVGRMGLTHALYKMKN